MSNLIGVNGELQVKSRDGYKSNPRYAWYFSVTIDPEGNPLDGWSPLTITANAVMPNGGNMQNVPCAITAPIVKWAWQLGLNQDIEFDLTEDIKFYLPAAPLIAELKSMGVITSALRQPLYELAVGIHSGAMTEVLE